MNEIINKLREFNKERNWEEFHIPENLAKSISLEAAELLEHFQWDNNYDLNELSDEIADVFIYLIILSDKLDLDIEEIILNKIEKNKEKYPVN